MILPSKLLVLLLKLCMKVKPLLVLIGSHVGPQSIGLPHISRRALSKTNKKKTLLIYVSSEIW